MGAGYNCMKYLFIFINIIFLLLAVAGIGVSIWMFVDPTFSLHFTQESRDYLIATSIFLLVSVILLIASLLGIYSVGQEVRKALIASFCLVLIIVVAEIAAGVWTYINRDNLEQHIRTSVKGSVTEEYDKDDNVKQLIDTLQTKLHCCGAERPSDWTRGKDYNLIISGVANQYEIPTSCCREGIDKDTCYAATHNVAGEPDKTKIYDEGCYTLIYNKLKENCCIILIVGGVILGIQLLGLILGLILACSMNRSHRYKA